MITTHSLHRFHKYPNIVSKKQIRNAEEVFVSDITYIPVEGGHLYLFLTMDGETKKIMGYKLSSNLKACNAVSALSMAYNNKIYRRNTIHHSDRGIQYCSKEFTENSERWRFILSMTEENHVAENSIAERLNGILKQEFGMGKKFQNIRVAEAKLKMAVKIYNNKRPHLSLNMMTPEESHKLGKSIKKL